ncbi:MAG: RecQ family ATP-dependent DNA helicase [Terriglobales bacterium]
MIDNSAGLRAAPLAIGGAAAVDSAEVASTHISGGWDLLAPLRRYWGYDSFRPKQENVIRSLLGGHDTCAVMPTGGGKSLCYQLPAVVSEKTVVVVSPLIALMQDQASQLAQMGIPAAALNSFLDSAERRRVMARACAGEYRLVYLSPERLAAESTFEWLARVPVGFFVVDEAHCISEWGHEFRPDYRQLSRLRTRFAGVPIAAFTASATRQVRHDILKQLSMREPHLYIASFHRKNLNYVAQECEPLTQLGLLGRALRHYSAGSAAGTSSGSAAGSVIVYAPTIKRVEDTIEYLEEMGIAAIPYHAKLEAATRRDNQERWMSDEVRVLVGTIAFGLGINKPSVRAVIHLSLPKSIEQYYQEAGRAGRDGRPADCVLLWQKRDHVLLEYFIGKIEDSAERERAWERKRIVSRFADSRGCRQRTICLHFGETPKWAKCDGCDNCGVRPAWVVEKADEKAIPRHARDDKTAKSRDDIERSRDGNELSPGDKESGRGRNRRRAGLRAVRDFLYSGSEDVEVGHADDDELAEYLREWRRGIAREKKVAAFVVLHDSTLEELCRKRPSTIAELMRVRGIGEHKAEVYGEEILQALRNFAAGTRAMIVARSREQAPEEETLRLLNEGKTLEEIARIRARQISTVIGTVAGLIEAGRVKLDERWISPGAGPLIEAACVAHGLESLRDIKDAVPAYVSFNDIRLVVAGMRAVGRAGPAGLESKTKA